MRPVAAVLLCATCAGACGTGGANPANGASDTSSADARATNAAQAVSDAFVPREIRAKDIADAVVPSQDLTQGISDAVAPLPDAAKEALVDTFPAPNDGTGTSADVAPIPCDPDTKPTPNAGLTEPAGAPGCPNGMIAVEKFCIDKWEAALVELTPAGAKPWSPFHNPGKATVKAVSLQGAVPQGYISGVQAKAACAAAGKRLCTDTEWLRACRGPAKFTYPYGSTLKLGTCNDHRDKHPAVEYFGTSAAWIWSQLGHPCINQQAKTVTKTGALPGCVSAEGAFDLIGNLHEWTADPAGTFRGGFYVDTKLNGPGCLYATTAHDTGHWDYSTGFRCCADLK
jgi:hypothetical protein